MDAVVAENVTRRYGDTVALDGVDLRVGEGEVFALVGPNGAGKTTMVRALTGTTDAEGEVALLGEDPRTVARERIGLLPQDYTPPERLSGRELIAYYAGLYDEARDVDAVLEDVGVAAAADTYYENLSGGQQRRVCVGAALVNDPDVLFLDEPTTGIDPAGRREIWGLLEDLVDAGTTLVLTTHDMHEAEHLADRVGLLADGELVAVDTPAQLVADHGGEAVLRIEGEVAEAPDLGYPTEHADGVLAVRGVEPTDIGEVVSELEAAGVRYDSVTWSEPSLEDVYLALTGSTFGHRRPGMLADPAEGGGDDEAGAPADSGAGGSA